MNKQLPDILSSITEYMKFSYNADFRLLGATGGYVLFYYYLFRATNNEHYLSCAESEFDCVISNIDQGIRSMHFADGLVGICCLIRHLQLTGFIDESYVIPDDIINAIYDYILRMISDYNDDFFYGSGGAMYFFILDCQYRNYSLSRSYISKSLEIIKNKGRAVFTSKKSGLSSIQTGIPHGYASWILLLCKIHESGISKDVCKYLLDNLVSYYLPYLDRPYDGDSFFPQTFNDAESEEYIHSRLGWCNGDIPCLYALLKYAGTFQDGPMRNNVLSKLIDVSKRNDLEQYSIYDAGLCHGASGLMHIFAKLYDNYGIKEFRDASLFWQRTTIAFGNNPKNVTGYVKACNDGDTIYYENSVGFIDGLAGIGLSIISRLYGLSSWDSFLLL